MIPYFSTMSHRGVNRTLREYAPPHVLFSFAFPDTWTHIDWKLESLLLDSGAYSAWRNGLEVDREEYLDFYYRMAEHFACPVVPVNLDVIPGQRGRPPSRSEMEDGIRRSLECADWFRAKGLPVIEVHHQRESLDLLERLVDRADPGHPVGLSPHKSGSMESRRVYLSACFELLQSRDPLPLCHGFGVSSLDLLTRYPFQSYDTSRWSNSWAFGKTVTGRGRTVMVEEALGDLLPGSYEDASKDWGTGQFIESMLDLTRRATGIWAGRGYFTDEYHAWNQPSTT